MTEKTVQKEPGKKPKPQQEVVVQIPLSELHPFPNHPFQVREDASMQETAESVKEYGVLVPALARPREDGGYRADGKNALSLDYRSAELFKQRATLLYEDVGDSYIGAVFAARSMELWLLEDMGFAVVAKFSVNAGEGEYVTEYRVYKGSDWADSEISLDLEDLVAELAALCDPYYEHEQPIYEL